MFINHKELNPKDILNKFIIFFIQKILVLVVLINYLIFIHLKTCYFNTNLKDNILKFLKHTSLKNHLICFLKINFYLVN